MDLVCRLFYNKIAEIIRNLISGVILQDLLRQKLFFEPTHISEITNTSFSHFNVNIPQYDNKGGS